MKNLLFILFSFLLIVGCANDDGDSSGSFKAKINGQQFEADDLHDVNLVHVDGGQILTIFAENEQYEFTLAISQTDINTNCMPSGQYINDFNDRECIIWLAYKHNGNTYTVHYPTEDDNEITSEKVNITSCSNGKISGTFSVTLEKVGEIEGLQTPDIIEITNGEFHNIEFNIY